MSKSDNLYSDQHRKLVDFAFDETVVSVFPDMIRRSVPGYELVIPMTGLLAANHLPSQGLAFDLGCSLGATTLAILHQLSDRNATIMAVDNSTAMLDKAKRLIDDERVQWCLEDIQNIDFSGADVVVMNYTLQFVPVEERQTLISSIAKALRPGGALIVSEKLRFSDPAMDDYFRRIHERFKLANGYSEMEVAGKRTALENVMVPETEEAHFERFSNAGFTSIETWYRCLNWASFLVRAPQDSP
ncbi:MAG: carboxy-S-adenosyl-L-methionine synthase CmoA [Pseudomonadaceae bacterium]|nr:carboxy-S-adenosyl-L-methionine synthase CmoA [Pseudomonadaceae bacterium]